MKKIWFLIFLVVLNANAVSRYEISDVVELISESVLEVETSAHLEQSAEKSYKADPFSKNSKPSKPQKTEQKIISEGSAVVIAKNLLLTNYHVVELADNINLTDINGKHYKATVVAYDKHSDLALLKSKGDFKVASFANSDLIKLGEKVVAVGNANGLGLAVSYGVVSAKNRHLSTNIYENYIQTDAQLNPGNSGGALFNLEGKVIGINSAIMQNGQSFSIPSNIAKIIVEQLKENKKVNRVWLGLEIQTNANKMVEIIKVESTSPALVAGVQVGDIVTQIQDVKVSEIYDIPKALACLQNNEKITLKIIRNGVDKNLDIYLKDKQEDIQEIKPDNQNIKEQSSTQEQGTENQKYKKNQQSHIKIMGLTVENAKSSVKITQVAQNMKQFNLMPGDLVSQIGEVHITNIIDFEKAINSDKQTLLLYVNRNGESIFSVIER